MTQVETPQQINPAYDLAKKEPLTTEEISAIRSENKIGRRRVYSYSTPEGTVSTMFISPDFDGMPDDKKEDILLFLRARQNGEGYRYEPLIVNSLLKQFQIGQRFGLSRDSLYTDFKLNVEDKGTMLLDNMGYLYLRVLEDHVNIFKRQGATDEELVTEFAGHIFHESIHESEGNMKDALFNGKDSFGEIATVTAQMAFYLDEGYTGPTSYNLSRFKAGLSKIQSGGTNSRDYDIATYVGVHLILQSLKEAYPAYLTEVEKMDPIASCQTIVAKLSPDQRLELIPTLKKAIANSADKKIFEDILEQTKSNGSTTGGNE